MAYKVGEGCLACGACVDACPVGAITLGDAAASIDASACIDCGSCAATCPAEVIAPE
ncbi:MAG: 4Fe-4S binding protein [Ruminococcus sp.]|nr:4Fe-4S binding protein [Ruminococcus sp.]